MGPRELMSEAERAAEKAYAPYSRFRVGAALLLSDGSVATGANVENRSYGLSNCAERSAVFALVSSGRKDIAAVAVAAVDAREPVPPCGACRQVLSEFCPPDTPLYYGDGDGGWIEASVGSLLPADSLQHMKDSEG